MRCIMDGSAKGNDLEGDIDHDYSSWGEGSASFGRVSESQTDQLLWSLADNLAEDGVDVGDLEDVSPHLLLREFSRDCR